MIAETTRLLRLANIDRFEATTGDAGEFPLDANSVDVVFTFNAIHHFVIPEFLREARRVLRNDGVITIYSRLISQNKTSIWGRYFPDFNTVERRLHSLDDIETAIRSTPGLELDSIKFFRFDRLSTLEDLIAKVRAGHYSTFSLYTETRLDECISEFRDAIMRNFSDPDEISWTDGNVLLTVKAC